MKRLFAVGLAGGMMGLIVLLMGGRRANDVAEERVSREEGRAPWTGAASADGKEPFHFAIVGDRTGAARPGVFERAVEQLNLMRPTFVVSVGDLIEGYTEDRKSIAAQWKDFEAQVRKLKMPFFYVPGNHDISNAVQDRAWRERFGKPYYHFVFRDVLFLVLNAEDRPGGYGGINAKQIAFVRRVLAEQKTARWTMVFVHRPLWDRDDVATNGWLQIEEALKDRPYTVFAGHEHAYKKFTRHGRHYYQLATTGGGSDLRGLKHGEVDHVMWVTMEPTGPVAANVLLGGVLGDELTVASR